MTSSRRIVLTAALLAVAWVRPGFAASTIEREFTIDPATISLAGSDGFTEVRVAAAVRETAPGRPDLPWIAERIELASGLRVTSVEVIDLVTEPLASSISLRTSIRSEPGLEPIVRTEPDPAVFGASRFTPEEPVRLGLQGAHLGKNVAYLAISPVRWNPVTRDLERVAKVRVRLRLESGGPVPLVRERAVDWRLPSRGAFGVAQDGPRRTAQPFLPTQVPSLLGSAVAYVIVTSDEQQSEFQRLADWKTQSGVPAVVRTMSFIRAEYPGGSDDAERIRMFIRDAYVRWGTQWVLLGGDTDAVPTRFGITTFYGGESIAADIYFSCLDGSWNDDGDDLFGEGYFSESSPGDNCDLMPEVYVGRAPTMSLADADLFVDRALQYVRDPATGGYQTRVLFFAEVLFPQNWTLGQPVSFDGAELAEETLEHLQYNPSIHYARLYENHLSPSWEPGALLETKQAVVESLKVGYNTSVHIGHGFRNVMSCADANLTNDDAFSLTNGNRLTNLYAINCTSNAIDFPCIGEAFMKAPGGGAVTAIGSSRFDFPTAGRVYQKEFFRLLYEDSVTAIGQLQALQKTPFVPFASYDGVHRWTQMTMLLLGDPELRVYTGIPRTLTVIHPGAIAVSDTTFNVNVKIGAVPLLGARVTAYKTGDDYWSAVTDGAGNVTIPFRPDNVGSFTLVVTGYDCKPYRGTMNVTASGMSVLVDGVPTIDDDNAGGTSGNSNGIIDVGETVDIMIPITNNGGAGAPAVTANLSTTDGDVTVVQPVANYGVIGVSGTQSPAAGFRVSVPGTIEDQREVPFRVDILDGGGRHFAEFFQVVVHAPEAFHLSHVVNDAGGNGNGIPNAGETVGYSVRLRNTGSGSAQNVTAILRNYDGLATVTDSMSSFGIIAADGEVTGDPFTFSVGNTAAILELRVSEGSRLLLVQRIDVGYPTAPTGLVGVGAATSVELTWAKNLAADLRGYNVYRSLNVAGPFTKVNALPTPRTSYYLNSGLQGLTLYHFRVTAVDSSGNESAQSAVMSVSTNPPSHTVFPIPMIGNTPSSVAMDQIYSEHPIAIAVGATNLHVFHPDGSSPVDADGSGTTFGDFSLLGSYFAAGPSIADLDGDGLKEVIAPTWNDEKLYAFDMNGNLLPNWPLSVTDPIWSSAAVGNVDNDPQMEIFASTNGNQLIGMNHDGTEVLNGDNNGSTLGIFKVLPAGFNPSTPALADLDNDGKADIIFGDATGNVYAWRWNGTLLPNFPVFVGGPIYSSIAVGYLDGPGDSQLDLVLASNDDSLYALTAAGVLRTGWPVRQKLSDNYHTPSVALADMNKDGFVDVVSASTDGRLFVHDRNGAVVAPWNGVRYSPLMIGSSESSPVVADINGDTHLDIVMGDEGASLAAFSGLTGIMMPGFPIVLDAEMRGTPGLCDCDLDGMTEIVAAGWSGSLYMWDYDFPFQPVGDPPWAQFHHDARRTGFVNTPYLVDVGDAPAPEPMPSRLELAPPTPNPARAGVRFRYAVPAELAGATYEIAIFDLSGRRVRSIERGVARPGRFTVEWDLRDGSGAVVDAGVYFSAVTLAGKSATGKVVVMR
jgi:hypothetical protein